MRSILCYSSILLFLASCGFQDNTVDMIVHNAVIYTVDGTFSAAQAMAIDGDTIRDIGAEREIRNRYTTTSLVDAKGQAIYPGFIDSHCHFVGYGLTASQVSLSGAKSWEECVERIQEYAKDAPGLWIEGRGWDENEWEVKETPENSLLNQLFPDRPVIVDRVDGHASIVNDKALSLALIDANERVIGGAIEIGEDGKPTGLLIDKAVNKVTSMIPDPDKSELKQALLQAQEDCFAVGLTTVDDAGLDTTVVNLIDELHEKSELKMRIYAMLEATDAGMEYMKRGMILKDRLTVRSIKLYGDGSLGSRGAALKRDYHDKHGHKGSLLSQPVFYKQWAALCNLYGFQMNTHCIGDRANQVLLSIYRDQLNGTNDKRWRIEHAQLISGKDMELFGRNNILPSVQPTHATSDRPWVTERVGEERLDGAYAYRTLLDQNGLVLLGTDFPVEGIDPLETFYSAVFRKDAEGIPEGGWMMEEAISREEALRGMTIWGAIGNFEEMDKGSLEIGKKADFVILDRDIMKVAESEVLKTQVMATYIGGERVFVR